ncbi:MAG: hypothetical protein RLZZ449_293 [Actinomycetota bacterium]
MRNPSDLPPRRSRQTSGFRFTKPSRGRLLVTGIVGAIVLLFVSSRSIASWYVDVLWFGSVGKSDVYWTILFTKAGLAAVFSAVFAVLLVASMWLADRLRPSVVPPSPEQRALDGYRQLGTRSQWVFRIVVGLVLGLMVGLPAATQWDSWLQFRHSQPFGILDPLFGEDVSFYVFQLPFAGFVVNWLFGALLLTLLVSAGVHYLNGGIRLQNQGRKVSPQAKAHISVLLALLALTRAGGYWLSRFGLTTSTRGVVKGATYTDVNAQLPAINLMILVSIAVALLFLWNVRLRGWRIPVLATGLWLIIATTAGTIYPAIVQRFSVQPNVSTKELPYIDRNLEATKVALGLDSVETKSISFEPITPDDVSASIDSIRDVRQLDPSEMRDRFALDEGQSSFYAIRDLDVDRYSVDGRIQQVLLGTRELNTDGIPNRTWVSRHLIYTHGCGVVAAPASQVTSDGRPVYVDLGVTKPQLYVGEGLSEYAVLGTSQQEQTCAGVANDPYSADGGVKLSSVMRRTAFALTFNEYNLFGSSLIEPESQILWVRNVRDRAEKVAPFLRFDADPYPVVVDGEVKWIIDAYTVSNRYPYSQSANVNQLTPGSGLNADFNYVRNSAKVVVDAYSGEMTFYVVDPTDPIIQTWSAVFPDLFTPVSKAAPEVVDHFRYPEDLFRVQTNMYGRYQFGDAALFFNRDAAWSVAQAPPSEPDVNTVAGGVATDLANPDLIDVQEANVARFEPYYTLFHEPGTTSTPGRFSMLRPFVPFSADDARKELRAFMVVSSEPETYGKITVYTIDGQLPEGPATVAAEFGSDPIISQQITLLDQRGSRVVFGDLQLVPVGKGLVYLRPLFVRPDDANARQIFVRKFLASYNNKVVIGESLADAVNKLFTGAGSQLGSATSGSTEETESGGTSDTSTSVTVPSNEGASPDELLRQAEQLFAEADAALGQNPPDFATYQKKLAEARALVSEAISLLAG